MRARHRVLPIHSLRSLDRLSSSKSPPNHVQRLLSRQLREPRCVVEWQEVFRGLFRRATRAPKVRSSSSKAFSGPNTTGNGGTESLYLQLPEQRAEIELHHPRLASSLEQSQRVYQSACTVSAMASRLSTVRAAGWLRPSLTARPNNTKRPSKSLSRLSRKSRQEEANSFNSARPWTRCPLPIFCTLLGPCSKRWK